MPKSKQEKIEGLEQHRKLQHDKEMQKKAKKLAEMTPVKHGPKR